MKEKTILVVEDERPLAEVVSKKLEMDGYDVVCARTIDQALEYMEELSKVDAVWLDHYLVGDKSGLDFVETLKEKRPEWKNVPVFVVTNTAGTEKIEQYIKFGVNKTYVKANHRLDGIIADIEETLTATS